MTKPDFKDYHWADGGTQLMGLDPVESVFTTGRGWGKDYLRAASFRLHRNPEPIKSNLAYIIPHGDGRRALFYLGTEGSEGMAPGWNEMFFDPGTPLDVVQSTVETILKLTE